mmetsp:Transcript_12240/g.16005  ORF Transcript_12240/g.16005 Transcript_12240/m.16005 type:complete len:424 (-) Transcript_12240:3-1274(-)
MKVRSLSKSPLALAALIAASVPGVAWSFTPSPLSGLTATSKQTHYPGQHQHQFHDVPLKRRIERRAESSSNNGETPAPIASPPPMFNGKRVLPGTIVLAGLKASNARVAGVYAILSADYSKNKGEGWEYVVHVSVTQDLYATLQAWESSTQSKLAHVRALSFSFPEPNAMQDVSTDWRKDAAEANAELINWSDPSSYLFDDDEDEDDDDDWDVEMTAEAMASIAPSSTAAKEEQQSSETTENEGEIISPFVTTPNAVVDGSSSSSQSPLPFTIEAVDRVLDEIRPYLIADGGNVAVVDADDETKVVSLELQGACGSCPSSTVTMQMGIERVLKENYGPDVSVQQVTAGEDVPKSLSYQVVEAEVTRLSAAVVAMGGVVKIVGVDEDTGVVQLNYRGANKVRQGLELALRDVPFVNAVQFVSED